jgi:hypothetical protein
MNYLEIFRSYDRLMFIGQDVWLSVNNQVSRHPIFLSPDQLRLFFSWAMEGWVMEGKDIRQIASDFYFTTKAVEFDGMILMVPTGEIQGTIPGCKYFGCILPNGSIHT